MIDDLPLARRSAGACCRPKPDMTGSAYSITSSARARINVGIVRPSALVDDEIECGRLLNRKISRLSSLQGAVDIASGAAKDVEMLAHRRRRAGATANSRPPLIAGSPAAAMSAAFDARNGSFSTMSASGLACVITATYYSSLMPRTYFCARLLETLD